MIKPLSSLIRIFCKSQLLWISMLLLVACSPKEQAAQEYFDSGLSFYEKGNVEKARIEFLNAIQANPQHGQAYYYLGLIAKKNGDIPLIYEHMRLAMHLDRTNIDARVSIAELLVFGQRFDEALTVAESILTIEQNNYHGVRLKAAALVGLKKYEEALALIETAKSSNSKDASLYGLSAIIANEQGKIEEALIELEKALNLGGGERIQYLLLRISINQEKKDYLALEQDYLELIELRPDEREYVFALAKIYVAKKQLKNAEKLLNRYVFSHGQDTKAKTVLLDVLAIRSPKRASATLDSMLKAQPNNFELRIYKVGQSFEKKEVESGKKQLEDIIASSEYTEKDILKARAMLAETLFKQQDIPGAISLLQKNLTIEPHHEETHLLLAHYELGKKSYEMAGQSLRVVLKNNPESEKALVLLGRMYTLSGSDLLANDSFRQALQLNPANVGAALPVAKKLLENQDLERSDNVISAVLKKRPLEKYLINFLIEIKLMKKSWREADALNQRLLHLGADADYEYFQGRITLGRKQYSKAIEHLEKTLTLDPNRVAALQALVSAYLALSQEKQVIQYLDNFNASHPKLLHGYIVSAQVYKQAKRVDKAIKKIEQALRRKPTWVEGYMILASYKLASDDSQGAIDVYKKGIAKLPKQENLKILLASYYESTQDYTEAEKLYQRILKQHPNNKIALNNYVAMLLDKLATPENLKKALELAKGLKSENNALFIDTYAWSLIKNKQYVEGEKYARMALERSPSLAELQYHLGIALKGLNRSQEAKKMFKRARRHIEGKEELSKLIELELKDE